jgi:hypothetical protein
MGPGTLDALRSTLTHLRQVRGVLVGATDANGTGDRYAKLHATLAADAAVTFERLRPPEGQDWNDVLVEKERGDEARTRLNQNGILTRASGWGCKVKI